MSGYNQKEDNGTYDYDTHSRPDPVAGYSNYAPANPSYDTHHQHHYAQTAQRSQPHGLPHPSQAPYTSSSSSSRDPVYSQLENSYANTRRRLHIDLTSYAPYRGAAGDTLRITFKSLSEIHPTKYAFFFEFGTLARLNATLSPANIQRDPDSCFHYNLTARVPTIANHHRTMPLMIDIQDENAFSIEQKHAGLFYYGDYQSYSTESRKRKLSNPSDLTGPSAKRPSSRPWRPLKLKDLSSSHPAQQIPIQNVSPYGTPLFSIPTLDRSPTERLPYAQIVPKHGNTHSNYGPYATSPILAPQNSRLRSPILTYGSYPPMPQVHSPNMAVRQFSSAPITRAIPTTPTWVRTTELRQQQSTPRAANYGSEPRFNPFAQYPDSKANLEIVGDLSSMCENWSNQELVAKRRLVEFTRVQNGNTITASFGPVTPDERKQERPVVSCIWWERKKEHFVTSVDTIALLEGLVAVRFTVEEKNRIRRNLEGFKPYTVAKNKDASDDIFRQIMGFGAPKPRNIEKDIKIFPWSILHHALKKIISKYSASYASTSSSIGPPLSSTNYGVSRDDGNEHPASPASTTSSRAHGYGGSMTTTALSPTTAGASSEMTSGLDASSLAHDLRSSASLPHLYGHGSGSHWPGAGQPQYPSYGTSLPQSAPSRSWNLENYINHQQQLGARPGEISQHESSYDYHDRTAHRSNSTTSRQQAGSSRYQERYTGPSRMHHKDGDSGL